MPTFPMMKDEKGGELFYWYTTDGAEIDFIWKRGQEIIAIEVKGTVQWKESHSAGFKSLLSSKIKPNKCYGIYLGQDTLKKILGLCYLGVNFCNKLLCR